MSFLKASSNNERSMITFITCQHTYCFFFSPPSFSHSLALNNNRETFSLLAKVVKLIKILKQQFTINQFFNGVGENFCHFECIKKKFHLS